MNEVKLMREIPEPIGVKKIPLNIIFRSEQNVREEEREVGLEDLMASIQKYGVLQPVVVIEIEPEKNYELIIGQRRYRACEELGERTIWAKIYPPEGFDERMKLILSLSENIQRRAIRKGDEIRVITRLYDELGSYEKVREELGISISKVSESVSIERVLPEKGFELLNDGLITKNDIKKILAKYGDDARVLKKIINRLSGLLTKGDYARTQKRRIRDALLEDPSTPDDALKRKADEREITERVTIILPWEIYKALDEVAKESGTDQNDLIYNIVENWLTERGHLRE